MVTKQHPGFHKMAPHGGSHPGFENVARSIAAKEGLPMDRARAILASRTRHASPAAKAANPRLNRVKG
jgi:hypothetical protein